MKPLKLVCSCWLPFKTTPKTGSLPVWPPFFHDSNYGEKGLQETVGLPGLGFGGRRNHPTTRGTCCITSCPRKWVYLFEGIPFLVVLNGSQKESPRKSHTQMVFTSRMEPSRLKPSPVGRNSESVGGPRKSAPSQLGKKNLLIWYVPGSERRQAWETAMGPLGTLAMVVS